MKKVNKGEKFLLVRINSKTNLLCENILDFYSTYNSLINKYGYVWFLKHTTYTKNININIVKNKLNGSSFLLIKDSKKANDKAYFCVFEELSLKAPDFAYPDYYKSFQNLSGLWFKIIKIYEIKDFMRFAKNVETINGNSIFNILKSSVPMSYFVFKENISYDSL